MAKIGADVEKAAELLRSDELVAIPTETVYGLAGNGLKRETIEKIYTVKNRPANNPLILHVASMDMLDSLVTQIPETAIKLAENFWPGPLTLVLPKSRNVPDIATAGMKTVAVRVPAHELTLRLLTELDFPLAAPSANLSNRVSPTTAEHVHFQIGKRIKYILDGGQCSRGIESTIVGFVDDTPIILRHGALSIDNIKKVAGKVLTKKDHNTILAPGMSPKHYSPKTRFIASENIQKDIAGLKGFNVAALTLSPDLHEKLGKDVFKSCLTNSGDLAEAAYNLYDKLFILDNMNFDCIVAEYMPNVGIGISINDRLKRASN
jgi:L-threonylcarbamoyladenylate synthase